MNLHTAFPTDDNGADAALARIRRDLVENERFDAAVSALEPLADQHPDSPDVHAELGRVYHFLGKRRRRSATFRGPRPWRRSAPI